MGNPHDVILAGSQTRLLSRKWAAVVLACALTGGVALFDAPLAHAGEFRVTCGLSHRSHDDPIVYPGQFGAAHRHDFYGARSTGAESTPGELRRSITTCNDRHDTAGYWHPTLSVKGRPVRGTLTAYYDRVVRGRRKVRPIPRNLKIVAGNHMARQPASRQRIGWRCIDPERPQQRTRAHRRPQRCRPGRHLSVWVAFPNCWDGTRRDSANHKDHMAFSRNGWCPKSHPERVARLVMRVDWPVRPRPRHIRLSSGPPRTMHMDFWNTWHKRPFWRLVDRCVNRRRQCGSVVR